MGGTGGPDGSGPLDDFAARLRELVANAGGPSLRALARLSRDIGRPYSRTMFSDKLNGRSKPDWQFVETLVRACARHAGRDAGPADLAGWRTAHARLLSELAAMRNDRRERSRGVTSARAELAAVPPDAEFLAERAGYLGLLRDRYRDLDHMNALARRTDGAAALPLGEIFVPQWVRAEPPRTELPREVWRRLIANGYLSERDTPQDVDRTQLDREFKAYADSRPRLVLDVLAETDRGRIVLLGDPGAGKSTLAAYLTLALADLAADDGADGHPLAGLAGHLPLFLELRSYAPHAQRRTFLDEIDRPHKPGHPRLSRRVLEPYLEQGGRALVVFDGLDEVFDKELREVIKWEINRFADRYPGVRAVVTSRITDYERERHVLDHGRFAHYTLQDLDSEQVAVFVRAFYAAAYPGDRAKADALTARLLGAVASSPAIAELAGNPMLLTTLTLLGRGQELPRNRRTALKHTVEVLVKGWDEEKHLEKYLRQVPGAGGMEQPEAEDKEALLRLVARRIQEGRPDGGGLAGNYLSRRTLVAVFTEYLRQAGEQGLRAKNLARMLVDQLRERDYILAKFGNDTFGFVHRALLDYLAADDIYTRFGERDLELRDIEELFRVHSTAAEWQEVLLLLAGMLKPEFAEKAIVALLESNPRWYQSSDPLPRHVLLAIRCLGEIRHPHKVRSAALAAVEALIALLETVSEPTDYPLAVALTQTLEQDVLPVLAGLGPDWAGRPAYETWYLARGQFLRGDSPGFAATAAAQVYVTLLGRDDRARDRLRTLAGWADSVMVRGAALEALARNWPREPQTTDLLRASAVGDPDWYVRREAVRTLAARWPGDRATGDLLRGRATTDPAPEVRGTALRWLAGGWREAETADLLREVGADPAERGEVRAVAVAELTAGWHDDERTRQWIRDRADDEDARVRAAAAQALAVGWHDDPATRRWLLEHAAGQGEGDPQVRVAAVHALAAGWPREPDTRELLETKARIGGDEDPAVRQAAVEALAVGWRGHPETAGQLRGLAGAEPDDDVRCAVTQALARYWPNDPATAELLEDRALTDPDWYVRATAIRALAGLRADQAEAGKWLRERATRDPTPYVRHVALSAAAAGWPVDPETVPWLTERVADGGENLDIRGAAIRALAAGWHDKKTLELLRTVGAGPAATGPAANEAARIRARTGAMRRVAVQSVAVGWRDHEQTQSWLRRRATDDDSPAVRRTALQLLAADLRWHADPATVALLRERALCDGFPEARRAAIRTLSAGWHDDPATAAWLRDHAFAGNDRAGKLAVIRTLATDWHDDPATHGWLRDRAAADPDPEVQREAARWLARGWPG